LPLRVIASQSAFVFKETKQDRRTIGHALGADVLLVGNVAQAGAAIAINARLVDTATDRTLWTGRFERSLDDMTSADLIVEAIAQGVGTLADTRPHARASRTILPEARDAFLRGRFFWAKRGEANAAIAVRYLSTAVQLQPDYAEAWAGLADVYAVNTGSPSPVIVPWPGDGIRAGEIAAREALRLSPRLGEAHAALGKLYVAQRRWLEAEQSFQRAIEFAPQYSTGRQWYGTMFLRLGRCDEAREQVELGARLDPLAVLVNEAVGSVFWNCGEPQRAIEQYEAVLRMHPDAASTRLLLARALTDAERFDDAIAVLDALGAGGESTISALACAYARSGRGDDARALLPRVSQPFLRASIFAALGDADAMWNALEQALTNAGGLQNLIVDRNFWPYRHAPRFLEFARRAGFPVPPMPIARFSRPLGNPDVRARRN
jgi:tetratricopeptide (TPR) repeat protein